MLFQTTPLQFQTFGVNATCAAIILTISSGIASREPAVPDIEMVEGLARQSPCIASGQWVRYYGFQSEEYLGGFLHLRMYDYTRLNVYYEQTVQRDDHDRPHFTKAGIYVYSVPPFWMTDPGTDDRYIRRAEGTYVRSTKTLTIKCMPKFDSIDWTNERFRGA